MRIIFVVFILLFSPNLFAKKKNNIVSQSEIEKIEIIDSLKQTIYRDTIKFDLENSFFTALGRMNNHSYSMLYVVNNRYIYLLDIITSNKVEEFVNEILDADKIDNILIIPKEEAKMIYGSRAQNGVVVITMKKDAVFNPFVAGLEMKKVKRKKRRWSREKTFKTYNNFSNRKKNELLLR